MDFIQSCSFAKYAVPINIPKKIRVKIKPTPNITPQLLLVFCCITSMGIITITINTRRGAIGVFP
jgi:hypothetical protein